MGRWRIPMMRDWVGIMYMVLMRIRKLKKLHSGFVVAKLT